MREGWAEIALAPPRAFGAALGRGRLRVESDDFVVEEDLGFAPSGSGPHALLRVRKRNANTEWVARELARAAGCRPGDVGFAGLKDRRAVATQWFSVPLPRQVPALAAAVPGAADLAPGVTEAAPGATTEVAIGAASGATTEVAIGAAPAAVTLSFLAAIRGPDFEVLEAHAHTKKLPRGALAGNRFTIRIRDCLADEAQLAERLEKIAHQGVPNYFGPQRFGQATSNLRKLTPDPNAIPPRERTYVFSAARSLVFNAVLAERVTDGTWHQLEAGDVANLDARGSIFPVDAVDESLSERAARLDVHPTGPLWGRGELTSGGRVRALEERTASVYPEPCELILAAGMRQERRSLRLAVRELEWERQGADLLIRFWLTRGSFATTVLRELFESEDGSVAYE